MNFRLDECYQMHKNNGTSFECRCVRKHTCIVRRRVTWMCKHLGVYDFDYLKNRYWVSKSHMTEFWKWWEETEKRRLSFDSKKQRSRGDVSSFLLTRRNASNSVCWQGGKEMGEPRMLLFDVEWRRNGEPHTVWLDQERRSTENRGTIKENGHSSQFLLFFYWEGLFHLKMKKIRNPLHFVAMRSRGTGPT